MKVATEERTKSNLVSSDFGWEKPQGVGNHALLGAYLKGRMDERTEADRILKKQFESNLRKAQEIGQSLFREISTNLHIKPARVFLRAASLAAFDFLFVFELSDYLSDKLFEVYDLLRKKKQEVSDDTFSITFQNMPLTENLEESCVVADGFYFYYEEKPH